MAIETKIKNKEVFTEVVKQMLEKKGKEADLKTIIEVFSCEGYKINPDVRYTRGILDGIEKKGGYCPCQVGKIPEIMCPCEHFTYMGHCCCKMFVKE